MHAGNSIHVDPLAVHKSHTLSNNAPMDIPSSFLTDIPYSSHGTGFEPMAWQSLPTKQRGSRALKKSNVWLTKRNSCYSCCTLATLISFQTLVFTEKAI